MKFWGGDEETASLESKSKASSTLDLLTLPATEAGAFYEQLNKDIDVLRKRVDQKLRDMMSASESDLKKLNSTLKEFQIDETIADGVINKYPAPQTRQMGPAAKSLLLHSRGVYHDEQIDTADSNITERVANTTKEQARDDLGMTDSCEAKLIGIVKNEPIPEDTSSRKEGDARGNIQARASPERAPVLDTLSDSSCDFEPKDDERQDVSSDKAVRADSQARVPVSAAPTTSRSKENVEKKPALLRRQPDEKQKTCVQQLAQQNKQVEALQVKSYPSKQQKNSQYEQPRPKLDKPVPRTNYHEAKQPPVPVPLPLSTQRQPPKPQEYHQPAPALLVSPTQPPPPPEEYYHQKKPSFLPTPAPQAARPQEYQQLKHSSQPISQPQPVSPQKCYQQEKQSLHAVSRLQPVEPLPLHHQQEEQPSLPVTVHPPPEQEYYKEEKQSTPFAPAPHPFQHLSNQNQEYNQMKQPSQPDSLPLPVQPPPTQENSTQEEQPSLSVSQPLPVQPVSVQQPMQPVLPRYYYQQQVQPSPPNPPPVQPLPPQKYFQQTQQHSFPQPVPQPVQLSNHARHHVPFPQVNQTTESIQLTQAPPRILSYKELPIIVLDDAPEPVEEENFAGHSTNNVEFIDVEDYENTGGYINQVIPIEELHREDNSSALSYASDGNGSGTGSHLEPINLVASDDVANQDQIEQERLKATAKPQEDLKMSHSDRLEPIIETDESDTPPREVITMARSPIKAEGTPTAIDQPPAEVVAKIRPPIRVEERLVEQNDAILARRSQDLSEPKIEEPHSSESSAESVGNGLDDKIDMKISSDASEEAARKDPESSSEKRRAETRSEPEETRATSSGDDSSEEHKPDPSPRRTVEHSWSEGFQSSEDGQRRLQEPIGKHESEDEAKSMSESEGEEHNDAQTHPPEEETTAHKNWEENSHHNSFHNIVQPEKEQSELPLEDKKKNDSSTLETEPELVQLTMPFSNQSEDDTVGEESKQSTSDVCDDRGPSPERQVRTRSRLSNTKSLRMARPPSPEKVWSGRKSKVRRNSETGMSVSSSKHTPQTRDFSTNTASGTSVSSNKQYPQTRDFSTNTTSNMSVSSSTQNLRMREVGTNTTLSAREDSDKSVEPSVASSRQEHVPNNPPSVIIKDEQTGSHQSDKDANKSTQQQGLQQSGTFSSGSHPSSARSNTKDQGSQTEELFVSLTPWISDGRAKSTEKKRAAGVGPPHFTDSPEKPEENKDVPRSDQSQSDNPKKLGVKATSAETQRRNRQNDTVKVPPVEDVIFNTDGDSDSTEELDMDGASHHKERMKRKEQRKQVRRSKSKRTSKLPMTTSKKMDKVMDGTRNVELEKKEQTSAHDQYKGPKESQFKIVSADGIPGIESFGSPLGYQQPPTAESVLSPRTRRRKIVPVESKNRELFLHKNAQKDEPKGQSAFVSTTTTDGKSPSKHQSELVNNTKSISKHAVDSKTTTNTEHEIVKPANAPDNQLILLQQVQNRQISDPYGDGGRYTGVMVSGKPHGQGTMHYKDGRIYTGQWKRGRWHGNGHAVFSNGDSYVGQYVSDQRQGHGRYEWSDGRVYDGGFHKDHREGNGTYTWPDGAVYSGSFRRGLRHGNGRYIFADGSVYSGGWQDGKYHGTGECIWSDGRSYKGDWLNGCAHGHGIEKRPDGTIRHEGQWRRDRPLRRNREP